MPSSDNQYTDNLYTASATEVAEPYYPEDDEDRKNEEQQQQGNLAASYPILADVDDWFESQILNASDIHNIQIHERTINGIKYNRTVSVEAQVLAYQLLKEILAEKQNEFKELAQKLRDV